MSEANRKRLGFYRLQRGFDVGPIRIGFLAICLTIFGCLVPNRISSTTAADMHPFHLCVGQMKWNAESHRWEVSLRLHPQDLELAMNVEAAQENPDLTVKTSVEDSDFPEKATLYIDRHLFLRRSAAATTLKEMTAILKSASAAEIQEDNRSKVNWIGMEQEKGWLWIHLEMESPKWETDKEKLWMVNELLLDSVPKQENTMAVDPVVKPKFSMQFKKEERIRELQRTR